MAGSVAAIGLIGCAAALSLGFASVGSAAVLGQPEALRRLEAIVHPLVREAEAAFLRRCRETGAGLAVLDVPLLLESKAEGRCDAVLVVSAPAEIQRQRVLARPEMTEEKLAAILARQMPDAQKRRRAHFIVDTARGVLAARRQVGSILSVLAGRPGRGEQNEAKTDA